MKCYSYYWPDLEGSVVIETQMNHFEDLVSESLCWRVARVRLRSDLDTLPH